MKHFHHGFCGDMISLDTCEGLTTTEMLCTISAKLNDIIEYCNSFEYDMTFDNTLTSNKKPCTAKVVGELKDLYDNLFTMVNNNALAIEELRQNIEELRSDLAGDIEPV